MKLSEEVKEGRREGEVGRREGEEGEGEGERGRGEMESGFEDPKRRLYFSLSFLCLEEEEEEERKESEGWCVRSEVKEEKR